MTTKKMDHASYQRRVRGLSDASLAFIIQDAKEAMEAMPENPNNGHYADEVAYCAAELARRRDSTDGVQDRLWKVCDYLGRDAKAHVEAHGNWACDPGKLTAALESAGLQCAAM